MPTITNRGSILIFPGRFQPFHNGHMSVLDKLLRRRSFKELRLVLGVVINTLSNNGDRKHKLCSVGDEHHFPERNPIPLTERIHMLLALWAQLDAEARNRLVVTAIPRPELYWQLVCSMFPQKRIWVVPRGAEQFDEEKARFFQQMGDKVLRISPRGSVSGREIRELIASSNPLWKTQVPLAIAKETSKYVLGHR